MKITVPAAQQFHKNFQEKNNIPMFTYITLGLKNKYGLILWHWYFNMHQIYKGFFITTLTFKT